MMASLSLRALHANLVATKRQKSQENYGQCLKQTFE
jgi:hypothetical protein